MEDSLDREDSHHSCIHVLWRWMHNRRCATTTYDVFISHAGEQKVLADNLYWQLKNHNFSAFLDFREIPVGCPIPQNIDQALHTASIGIFILSGEFVAKEWPVRELEIFLNRCKQSHPPDTIPIFYSQGEGGRHIAHVVTADDLERTFQEHFDNRNYRYRGRSLEKITELLKRVRRFSGIIRRDDDDVSLLRRVTAVVRNKKKSRGKICWSKIIVSTSLLWSVTLGIFIIHVIRNWNLGVDHNPSNTVSTTIPAIPGSNSSSLSAQQNTKTRPFQLWVQRGPTIESGMQGSYAGSSVSMSSDGHTVAIGFYGLDENKPDAGYVQIVTYHSETQEWQLQGATLEGDQAGDWFGYSTTLSANGSILAIGAPRGQCSVRGQCPKEPVYRPGYVQIYQYNKAKAEWQQMLYELWGAMDSDLFGNVVSLSQDGKTVAVGAPGAVGSSQEWNPEYYARGYVGVYHFGNDKEGWTKKGNYIYGASSSARYDAFGLTLALSQDGSTVVIGAPNGSYAQVFQWNNGQGWQQMGQDLNGGAKYESFGHSVALSMDGNIVAVSSIRHNRVFDGGVRVFRYNATATSNATTTGCWNQLGFDKQLKGDPGTLFGSSLSLGSDGTLLLAVGAKGAAWNGKPQAGRVEVFHYHESHNNWSPFGSPIYGEDVKSQVGSERSLSMSQNGEVILIGSPFPATGRSRAQAYEMKNRHN